MQQRGETNTRKLCQKCRAMCCKPLLAKHYFTLSLQSQDLINFVGRGLSGLIEPSSVEKFGFIDLPLFRIGNHIFGHCPLLDYPSGDCSIYGHPHLPYTCRLYPYCLTPSKQTTICLLRYDLAPREYTKHHSKAKFRMAKLFKREMINNSEYFDRSYRIIRNFNLMGWGWIVNKYGKFYISNMKLVKPFIKLLDDYARHINQKQLVVAIRILDSNHKVVNTITGFYGIKKLDNPQKVVNMISEKIAEADEKNGQLDPRMILGVIYEDEILNNPEYWREAWNLRIRAWLRANS